MGEVILNNQQAIACELIKDWFENREGKKQTFTLAGYAGTGKTFLVNHVINNVLQLKKSQVAFTAPTGKAASVLIQRGCSDAMTIHRLIYNCIDEEEVAVVDGKEIVSHKTKFVKKNEKLPYKLVVVDEISMVDKEILLDLLSFGVPVLCCGDVGQLPALFRTNGLLDNPDAQLTEIVRQAEDNTIIKIATMARQGQQIPSGNYGDVIVLNKSALTESQIMNLMKKADQILCGRNATRRMLNQKIKKDKGIPANKLNVGEKIICCVNNWEKYIDSDRIYNFVNGIMGTVISVEYLDESLKLGKFSFKPDFLSDETEEFLFDTKVFETGEFSYDMHQRVYEMSDGSYKLKQFISDKKRDETVEDFRKRVVDAIMAGRHAVSEEQINQIDSGYCISVHKSQGSEWDKVLLFDESYLFSQPEKWLYTAITRARKKLVILK